MKFLQKLLSLVGFNKKVKMDLYMAGAGVTRKRRGEI